MEQGVPGPEFDSREVCGGAGGAGGQNLTVKRSVLGQWLTTGGGAKPLPPPHKKR